MCHVSRTLMACWPGSQMAHVVGSRCAVMDISVVPAIVAEGGDIEAEECDFGIWGVP